MEEVPTPEAESMINNNNIACSYCNSCEVSALRKKLEVYQNTIQTQEDHQKLCGDLLQEKEELKIRINDLEAHVATLTGELAQSRSAYSTLETERVAVQQFLTKSLCSSSSSSSSQHSFNLYQQQATAPPTLSSLSLTELMQAQLVSLQQYAATQFQKHAHKCTSMLHTVLDQFESSNINQDVFKWGTNFSEVTISCFQELMKHWSDDRLPIVPFQQRCVDLQHRIGTELKEGRLRHRQLKKALSNAEQQLKRTHEDTDCVVGDLQAELQRLQLCSAALHQEKEQLQQRLQLTVTEAHQQQAATEHALRTFYEEQLSLLQSRLLQTQQDLKHAQVKDVIESHINTIKTAWSEKTSRSIIQDTSMVKEESMSKSQHLAIVHHLEATMITDAQEIMFGCNRYLSQMEQQAREQLSLLQNKVQELEQQLKTAETKHQQVQHELTTTTNRKVQDHVTECQQLRIQLNHTELQLGDKEKECINLTQQLQGSQAEVERVQDRSRTLQLQQQDDAKSISQLRQVVNDLTANVQDMHRCVSCASTSLTTDHHVPNITHFNMFNITSTDGDQVHGNVVVQQLKCYVETTAAVIKQLTIKHNDIQRHSMDSAATFRVRGKRTQRQVCSVRDAFAKMKEDIQQHFYKLNSYLQTSVNTIGVHMASSLITLPSLLTCIRSNLGPVLLQNTQDCIPQLKQHTNDTTNGNMTDLLAVLFSHLNAQHQRLQTEAEEKDEQLRHCRHLLQHFEYELMRVNSTVEMLQLTHNKALSHTTGVIESQNQTIQDLNSDLESTRVQNQTAVTDLNESLHLTATENDDLKDHLQQKNIEVLTLQKKLITLGADRNEVDKLRSQLKEFVQRLHGLEQRNSSLHHKCIEKDQELSSLQLSLSHNNSVNISSAFVGIEA